VTKVLLRAVDLETGGLEPPACVIEIGHTDVIWDSETRESVIEGPFSQLFQATHPLDPENIAVHHLLPSRLAEWPVCTDADLRQVATSESPAFLVAAFCQFERKWITDDMIGTARWICTVKAAARLYPDANSHSNQAVRYLLGLDLADDLAMPPHRAGPDSFVTAHILAHMLKTETVRDLVAWTALPVHMPVCPIGKHKNAPWADVPADFLQWMLRTPDMSDDLKYHARQELERRRDGG